MSDQVIVPEPSLTAMTAAIRELVGSGDQFRAGTRQRIDHCDMRPRRAVRGM